MSKQRELLANPEVREKNKKNGGDFRWDDGDSR